jgi:ribonuclease J
MRREVGCFDEKIPHGDIMIDGIGVGDVGDFVIEDRQKLAEGVVVLALDRDLEGPERRSWRDPMCRCGALVFVKDADAILRDVSKIFVSTVEEESSAEDGYNLESHQTKCL